MINLKRNIFFLSVCVASLISNSRVNASWLTSCKACVSILESCNIKKCSSENECITCSQSFGNTKCDKCFTEVFTEKDKLLCDYLVPYHNMACTMSCKVRTSLKGVCDAKKGGQCTCTADISAFNVGVQGINISAILEMIENGSTTTTPGTNSAHFTTKSTNAYIGAQLFTIYLCIFNNF